MAGRKKFAVVKFSEADSIEVIPSVWLINNTQGRWPSKKSLSFTSKCIRECVEPQETWDILDLKVLYFSKTFKSADKKAKMALNISSVDTSSSEEEIPEQKKGKDTQCYSSDMEGTCKISDKKANMALDIANVNTSSEEELPEKRKIKKNTRYYCSDMEETSKNGSKKAKRSLDISNVYISSSDEELPEQRKREKNTQYYASDMDETFKTADKKAKMALDIMNVDTSSSENELPEKRKRKKNTRYYGSDMEETFTRVNKKAKIAHDILNINTSSLAEPSYQRKKKKSQYYYGDMKHMMIPKRKFGHEYSSDDDISASFQEPRKFYLLPVPTSKVLTTKLSKEIMAFSQSPQSVPSISKNNARVESSNTSMTSSTLEKVLKALVDIKKDIKEIKNDQLKFFSRFNVADASDNANVKAFSVVMDLPDGTKFPLSEDDELVDLEEKLKRDKNLQSSMVNYFDCICSGRTPSSFLLSLCRRLLTKDLAMTYSRLGRKGKKSFEGLPVIMNIILASTSHRFPELSRQELSEKFGRVLATASDWEGRKPKVAEIKTMIEDENSSCFN